MSTVTATQPDYVTRLLVGKRDGTARRITARDVPEGVELWRVSYTEARTVGGNYGGWARDEQVVRWVTYVRGQWIGNDARKATALDYARHVLSR